MNPKRFGSNSSGQLIKVGQGDAAYLAFVPAPLPPNLPLDLELVRTLSQADHALGELAGLARTMPNPQLLVQPFIRREAWLSSRIEGTQADITDLYTYEAAQLTQNGSDTPPPGSDVQELSNYVNALQYGLKRIETLPMSRRLISEQHERLMHEVRGGRAYPGEFRHTQNWIGGSSIRSAVFVPPPVPEMADALNALEAYLHQPHDYPPLIRLALIHYQFEAIHPFVDGNGRTGRLLISLLSVHWKLLPEPLLYLSAFFERRRQDYYSLLLTVSERGTWRDWVIFFLEGVAEQATDAISRAKRLQDLQTEWRKQLIAANATARLLLLADSLFESPVLTMRQAQHILNVTHRSAQQSINKLVEAEIVTPVGTVSRTRLYAARDILSVVGENVS